jgi:hypothetical protein
MHSELTPGAVALTVCTSESSFSYLTVLYTHEGTSALGETR